MVGYPFLLSTHRYEQNDRIHISIIVEGEEGWTCISISKHLSQKESRYTCSGGFFKVIETVIVLDSYTDRSNVYA